jgi:thiol-disulfide isomerase/thioredoxin
MLLTALLLARPVPAADRPIPDFQGLTGWINAAAPLTAGGLRGKVVLVDFWTYSCVNCLRTLPHIKAWHERYNGRGLVVLGVHTPEFDFEKDPANVRRAVLQQGIAYPVAQDNDFKTWRAFGNRAWPTHYLVDKKGIVRHVQVGEGGYEDMERRIRALLDEPGPPPSSADADLSGVKTPEIYLGHRRLKGLANKERPVADKPQDHRRPATLPPDTPALEGRWRLEAEAAVLESDAGAVLLNFEAPAVHMVLSSDKESRAEVLLDGRPLDAKTRGADVAADGFVRVREPRLYSLAKAGPGRHTLEIRFQGAGLQAFTFTFG